MDGTLEDAKDIFHDAMINLYERVMQSPQNTPENPKAYLKVIAKNLWLQQLGKQQKVDPHLWAKQHFKQQEKKEESDWTNTLQRYLMEAGQKCMKILTAFYYHNWSMNEIAGHFGFRTIRSATVQKYKCLEKVRDQVKKEKETSKAESYA